MHALCLPECLRRVGFEGKVFVLVSRCNVTTSTEMCVGGGEQRKINHKTGWSHKIIGVRERERERERENAHFGTPPQIHNIKTSQFHSLYIRVQSLGRMFIYP